MSPAPAVLRGSHATAHEAVAVSATWQPAGPARIAR